MPLEKDYHVIAHDANMMDYYELIISEHKKDKKRIKICQELDFKSLPLLDLAMASFILPFYDGLPSYLGEYRSKNIGRCIPDS
jgi:hypothetical protein